MLEERSRDATHRRMIMGLSTLQSQNSNRGDATNEEADECMKVGWLMDYNHREVLAGIEPQKKGDVASLETLSSRSFALVLKEYIDACGREYVRERIAVLPGNLIMSISVECKEVTDSVAYVLGRHSHVENLVLNARQDFHYTSAIDDGFDENIERLTSGGLLSMNSQIQEYGSKQTTGMLQDEFIDSWEELDTDEDFEILHGQVESIQGCCNLQRLELRNFTVDTAADFIEILRSFPKLTHLSLGKSLNSISGPEVLLWDDGAEESSWKSQTKTMVDVLPNLQILDLSGCHWLHYDLLASFLKRITRPVCDERKPIPIALEMICVGGCCKYLSRKYQTMNGISRRKPMVCIRPPI